jgi:hypothetical protein
MKLVVAVFISTWLICAYVIGVLFGNLIMCNLPKVESE